MKVSAQYAEEHLTDILNAADSGAEVEIARPDQPTYRLTIVKSEPTKPKGPRILGAGRGDRIGRKHLLGAGEDSSPSRPTKNGPRWTKRSRT